MEGWVLEEGGAVVGQLSHRVVPQVQFLEMFEGEEGCEGAHLGDLVSG